jgi:hypothetical protein
MATTFVIGYNGRAVTGFQLRTSCMKASANMGAAADPRLAMTRSFDNGMQPGKSGGHVSYIEVYYPDVVPEMQSALDDGAARFSGASTPRRPPNVPIKPSRGNRTPPG